MNYIDKITTNRIDYLLYESPWFVEEIDCKKWTITDNWQVRKMINIYWEPNNEYWSKKSIPEIINWANEFTELIYI